MNLKVSTFFKREAFKINGHEYYLAPEGCVNCSKYEYLYRTPYLDDLSKRVDCSEIKSYTFEKVTLSKQDTDFLCFYKNEIRANFYKDLDISVIQLIILAIGVGQIIYRSKNPVSDEFIDQVEANSFFGSAFTHYTIVPGVLAVILSSVFLLLIQYERIKYYIFSFFNF